MGADLTASIAVGLCGDLEQAVAAQEIPVTIYQPAPARAQIYEGIDRRYVALTLAMKPFWSGLYEAGSEVSSAPETPVGPVMNYALSAEIAKEMHS